MRPFFAVVSWGLGIVAVVALYKVISKPKRRIYMISTLSEYRKVISLIQADLATFNVLGYCFYSDYFIFNGSFRYMHMLKLGTHSGISALIDVSDRGIANQLKVLLEDKTILKVTYGPPDYGKQMLMDFGVQVKSSVNLKSLAEYEDLAPEGIHNLCPSSFGLKDWTVKFDCLLAIKIYQMLLEIYHTRTGRSNKEISKNEFLLLSHQCVDKSYRRERELHSSIGTQTDNNEPPIIYNGRKHPRVLPKPKVHIITTLTECRRVLSLILADVAISNVLGFDCEWVTRDGVRQPVALLQLATHSGICGLFRLSHLNPKMPAELKMLLEDKTVLKVGVDPLNDANHLLKDYQVQVKSTLDLRYLAQYLGKAPQGLAKLSKAFVGVELNKDWRVRCSLWDSEVLTKAQVDYAAADGLVAIEIYKKIMDIFGERNNAQKCVELSLLHRDKHFKCQRRQGAARHKRGTAKAVRN